nr:polyprotein [Cassava torrado-like virus 2]
MSQSSVSGLRPLRQNDAAGLIAQLETALLQGEHSKKKSRALGCMVMVRSSAREPTFTPLYDDVSRNAIVEIWNKIKQPFVSHPDAGNLYFHLQGVLFLVVPHVQASSGGKVTIKLCSSNDPQNPIIKKKVLQLSDGPQAFCMTAGFCLPFIREQVQFYYSTCCSETQATIPCSVMAIWNQSIEPRAACYEEEEVMHWMIKKLKHPKLLGSEHHAKTLLSRAYGSEDARLDDLMVARSLHRRSLSLGPQEAQDVRLNFGSNRFLDVRKDDLLIPTSPSVTHASTPPSTSNPEPPQRDRAFLNDTEDFMLSAQSGHSEEEESIFQRLFGKKEKKDFFFDCTENVPREADVFFDAPEDPIRVNEDAFIREYRTEWFATEKQFHREIKANYLDVDATNFALWYYHPEDADQTVVDISYYRLMDLINKGKVAAPPLPLQAHVRTEEEVQEQSVVDTSKEYVSNNDIQGMFGKNDVKALQEATELFDFSQVVVETDSIELPLQQPAVVSSNSEFLVDVHSFKWKTSTEVCESLVSVALPEVLMTATHAKAIGPRIMTFFDSAVLEFSSFITVPRTLAANGELLLVWDEGNFLGQFGSNINQATLLSACGLRVSAQSLMNEMEPRALRFKPLGIGKYLPLDSGLDGSNVGSLRVFVLNGLQTGTNVTEFTCNLHIYAKVLATNIMQPGRLIPQAGLGMPQGSAVFPSFPLNHLLFSSQWKADHDLGSAVMLTFSPACVFTQSRIMQPSLACNLLANCSWWTGTCEFEIKFNKTPFHSGRLIVGFGSISSELKTYTDVFSLSHVVCDLNKGDTFHCNVRLDAWNGKNFLSAGRKESLPKPSHQARQRIFIVIGEPLQSTIANVAAVNVTLILKSIKNLEVGGGVPIKPIFGHMVRGESSDFFYADSDTKAKYKQPSTSQVEPQMSIRSKFSHYALQYVIEATDKRYLVLPVAPWSYFFRDSDRERSKVRTSIVNPHIGYCSNFVYWKGAIKYLIVVHRKNTSTGLGGILQILLENTGYPKEPGLYEGSWPLAHGGGQSWCFPFGTAQNTCEFQVDDEQLYMRRLTRARKMDTATSRLSTRSDRLGNLIIVLPPKDLYNTIDVCIAAGPDFSYQVHHPSIASSSDSVGEMDGNIYGAFAVGNKFLPAVNGFG